MNKVLVITKRELGSYFDSLIAYFLIIIFLGVTGILTWLFGNTVFLIGQADLRQFFEMGYLILWIFIPAITMRSIAEENKSGTIELLSTKAVTDWQIVVGKWLACWALIGIVMAFTIPFYVTVANLGNIDHGATLGGYFGLMVMSGAYVAIGIFASSTTNNQIIAFLVALIINVFFHFLFSFFASTFTGGLAAIFDYLSARTHYESLARGVVDTRDLIYFVALIFISLLFSKSMLAKRNWHD